MLPTRFDRLVREVSLLDPDLVSGLVVECTAASISPAGLALRFHLDWAWSPADECPRVPEGAFEVHCRGPRAHALMLGEIDGLPTIEEKDARLDAAANAVAEVYVHTKLDDPLPAAARLAMAHEAASAAVRGGLGLSATGVRDALDRGYGLLATVPAQAVPLLVRALDAERIDHVVLPREPHLPGGRPLRLLTWGESSWVVAEEFTSRDLDDAGA